MHKVLKCRQILQPASCRYKWRSLAVSTRPRGEIHEIRREEHTKKYETREATTIQNAANFNRSI